MLGVDPDLWPITALGAVWLTSLLGVLWSVRRHDPEREHYRDQSHHH